MIRRPSASSWAAAALVAVLAAGWALPAWKAWSDPGIAWLAARGTARWIRYPTPADTKARALVELGAVFRRSFQVGSATGPAVLRVRAFRRAEVRLNGRLVALGPEPSSWKAVRTADVSGLLAPGANQLDVVVANEGGPPALWLELRGPGLSLDSDRGWEATLADAAWRPAALAEEPPAGRRFDPLGTMPSPWEALRLRWPTLLAFAALSAAAALGARWAARRWPALTAPGSPWPVRLAGLVAAVLWTALFVNDSPSLPLELGFDAPHHLDYVRYLLERHALPLANEGWEMFQPPLYYLAVALGLGASGLDLSSPGAPLVFRAVGLLAGIANVLLVGATLRRLFPERPVPQVLGVALAAFLPCMLYLHQFPTNEPLAAALASAVVLVAVGLLQDRSTRVSRHALLGALLGLALLAKFSTLLLVPVVLAALAWRAARAPREARRASLVALAAVPAAALAVCGWHFGRVWLALGNPLAANWEGQPGLGWWSDPGYRTAGHFLRFGRVLVAPLFAGFDGFWDGIYSTLWGDGLLSGLSGTSPVPPWWSPSLASAGYLLALVPTAVVLAGAVSATRAWIRRPSQLDGLLLGIPALVLIALVVMSLRVPTAAQDKAFYGLLALAPLCALAGRGVEALAGGRTWRAVALAAALGTWAATSYASLWVDHASAGDRLAQAIVLRDGGDGPSATALLRTALADQPEDWRVRVALARALVEGGGSDADIDGLLRPGEAEPALAPRLLVLALRARERGDLRAALAFATRASELDPDDGEARLAVAGLLESAGELGAAIDAWREVLRIAPLDRAAHAALAVLYARAGQEEAAAFHRMMTARLGG